MRKETGEDQGMEFVNKSIKDVLQQFPVGTPARDAADKMETAQTPKQPSAIKSVYYYKAEGPVECCDRCSQGIRHVALVTYKDGETQKYGMDCIEKILANVPTFKALFQKNLKLVSKYRDYLAILTGPVENMKRGREYFNSGLYFIADSKGQDIFFQHWFFHPEYDAAKNAAGNSYVVKDPAVHVARAQAEINHEVPKLRAEIERIELFLARVLAKAQAAEAAGVTK